MEKRKGIRSLIPAGTLAEEAGERVMEVEVESLAPNPRQPRVKAEEEALAELTESIKEHGVLQPLVVRRRGEGYELIAGERRLAAARRAGLTKVPVVVREATDEESLELALIENLQREDINPMEEAVAYQRLLEEFRLTQEQVAQRVGKSRAAVANSLRLLKLPAPIQESLRRGEIEEGHAKVLAGLPEPARQMRVWRRIMRSGISVKALAMMVARVAGRDVPRGTKLGQPKKPRGALDPNLEDLAVRLMGKLSTKVVIRPRRDGQGGVIEVHYGDDEHLNQIFWDIVR